MLDTESRFRIWNKERPLPAFENVTEYFPVELGGTLTLELMALE